MNQIVRLPENLVKKIAAGEVIERPASVVKELIENSIDAGATNISVEIQNGGLDSIRIVDDGKGMNSEDAKLAYELHTTSKIKNEEDLNQILTFGFRGEALASIASVSQIIIHTAQDNNSGLELTVENSDLISEKSLMRSKGTSISVNDLFRHLPARKKFLSSGTIEYRHVLGEVYKIALGRPAIGLSLSHNGKQILDLPAEETLSQRILSIFPEINDSDLISVEYLDPRINLNGFVIHPNKLSSKRNWQYLFLNNRYIIDRTIIAAIKEAYHTVMPPGNQPGYFLTLGIDPSQVDINVHPRKLEVKIEQSSQVFVSVKNSIRKAIEIHMQNELKGRFMNSENKQSTNTPTKSNFKYSFSPSTSSRTNYLSDSQTNQIKYNTQTAIDFFDKLAITDKQFESKTQKFFQIFNTYVVSEEEDKLIVLDQHAADERVNYERLLGKIESGELIERQDLLIPINIKLNQKDIELLESNKKDIERFGIDIDTFGTDTIKINSLPAFAREINHLEFIEELIDSFEELKRDKSTEINHKVAASMACHGSIRAGRELNQIEMQKLFTNLFNCKLPHSCPHGRPIIWEISRYDIAKNFKRS